MAEAIALNGNTQEQQLLEMLSRTKRTVDEYLAANPTADIQGFLISQRVDLRRNEIRFAVSLPLEEIALPSGGLSLGAVEVLGAFLGPVLFEGFSDNDPLTMEGVAIEF